MSNKLVKEDANKITMPGDEVMLLDLKFTQSGKIMLKSPLPPKEVCKLLDDIKNDLLFEFFEPKEQPMIQPVAALHRV